MTVSPPCRHWNTDVILALARSLCPSYLASFQPWDSASLAGGPPSAILGCEELHQHRSQCRWVYVVLLSFQDACLRIGDNVRERPRRLAHEREAPPTGHHERRCRDGRQLCRQRVVAHDSSVVGERVSQLFLSLPEWLGARVGDELGREATTFVMKYSTASPRWPADIISLYRCTWSAGGRLLSSRLNGGSQIASFVMVRPLAAASSARAPPEDVPYTNADLPAASITASRSSTSRSTA